MNNETFIYPIYYKLYCFCSYPPNVKSCVKKEIARLEEKALNANTEDEWLACELQAVELQISLVSEDSDCVYLFLLCF